MRPRRRAGLHGQTMVEFALVAPLFLIAVMACIDFSGYFGSRLSVENATREGVRFAVTQACDWSGSACANTASWTISSTPSSTSIEGVVRAKANYPVDIPNVDCNWYNSSAGVYEAPSWPSNPPGETKAAIPSGQQGCITIVYFNIQATAETLCAWWSASSGWVWVNISSYGPTGSGATHPCVAPGSLIQITVMWHYSPVTPLPMLPSSALDTTATIQLTEED